MDVAELKQKAIAQLESDAKVLLANQIALLFDDGVELGLDELKTLIPGTIDDTIIDLLAPQVKPIAKAYLLALIAKI